MTGFASILPPRGDLDWCWYLRRQGRAGAILERALHDIGVLQPGGWAPWQASTMTDTGAPVEMVFGAGKGGMSLRTEVDDPRNDPRARLGLACQHITALGGTLPPAPWRDVVAATQSGGGLTFGAWLELHAEQSTLGLTLLAEIPATVDDVAKLVASPAQRDLLRAICTSIRLTKAGYETRDKRVTLWFTTQLPPQVAVPQLAQMAKVADTKLRDVIDRLTSDRALPGPWGFSLCFQADDPVPELTIQLSAKALFATDHAIAARLRRLSGAHIASYAVLADHLPPAPAGRTHHGTIGLQARADMAPKVSVSLAAPWLSSYPVQ